MYTKKNCTVSYTLCSSLYDKYSNDLTGKILYIFLPGIICSNFHERYDLTRALTQTTFLYI